MNSITPLVVVQNLSEDYFQHTRDRTHSNEGFAPWNDLHMLPKIKNKYNSRQTKYQKYNSQKNTQNNRKNDKRTLYHNTKNNNLSHKKIRQNNNSVPHTTLDLSQLPHYSLGKPLDRNCNSRFKKVSSINKKQNREQFQQYRSVEQQRTPLRAYDKTEKYEQYKKRIKGRKHAKPVYEGIVTKQYIFPRKASLQPSTMGIPFISFPLQMNKETSLQKGISNKMINHTHTSFFLKHKYKRTYDQLSASVEEPRGEKGLSELLQLSSSLFQKVFRENRI